MFRITEAFVRWIAPVLSFTADEMWPQIPGERAGNVLFATWYDGLAPLPGDAALSMTDFDALLLALRDQVAKVLEPMRAR
jgi:isoleucyl-tRNA synthetase